VAHSKITHETVDELPPAKKTILGFQHLLAMFGATVLVPFLTGIDPSLAILTAGIGTLIFHYITGGKVPVFLGSSFAFIGAISLVLSTEGIGAVKTGIIAAGLVYVLLSIVARFVGTKRIQSFFPAIVVGPVIMVIGLRLASVALSMAGYQIDENGVGSFDIPSLVVASSVVLTMIAVAIYMKGFFKLVPIIFAIVVGYTVAALYGLVDFAPVLAANWFGLPALGTEQLLAVPVWSWAAIIAIAPIAFVTFIEHFGDITANGAVVKKDFLKDPGIKKTLLGDGVATLVAGVMGGPANTTYGENTGVLAVTKVYSPAILRLAAMFAIGLALFGKFGTFLTTIPTPVMGGVSVILFGMIASVGVRAMVDARTDLTQSRNLLIASVILVTGIAIDAVAIDGTLSVSGLAIAALLGVVLNKLLPL
jgi:uracil permease